MFGQVVQAQRFGHVEYRAEHAESDGQPADLLARPVVHALVDELGHLLVVPADRERAVSRVDQTRRGADDGAQRVVQIEAGGDGEHRFDEAVHSVTGIDDQLDAFLDLAEQFTQSQLGQRVAHRVQVACAVVGHLDPPRGNAIRCARFSLIPGSGTFGPVRDGVVTVG